ncbi:hypothetical protein MMYC01_201427 [Madurella mycetomatis]|uniref:TfuA-like core domain-containing protein n=1 Tax=Madurella mycetomatis TaxID=100816 RepID=A0A175W4S2_9PEZI|nr:hypothetical protein MMYC01_203475 [Madurella mycetomatis]KXX81351.1 hypothetical protein MMYC01_201427 [Madurella mycetomatis]
MASKLGRKWKPLRFGVRRERAALDVVLVPPPAPTQRHAPDVIRWIARLLSAAVTRTGPFGDAEAGKVKTGVSPVQSLVCHCEILLLVEQGVTIAGRCSSIGALRAAKLCPSGILGAGRVFTFHRDGVITGDEEVAIVPVRPTRGTGH